MLPIQSGRLENYEKINVERHLKIWYDNRKVIIIPAHNGFRVYRENPGAEILADIPRARSGHGVLDRKQEYERAPRNLTE